MNKRILAIVSLAAAIGCGGGDGSDGTALEGIYSLSSWTRGTCDAPGGDTFESSEYSHFFVRHDAFFGESTVNAVMCADIESCRSDAADTDTLFIGNFAFDDGSDADGWTGARILLLDDSCGGTVSEGVLTGEAGSAVRIDQELRTVADVPRDGEGECDRDAAREQAASQPCEQLEVVTGAFVEGI